ncbi:mycothiol synthase [Kitasatospora nipponensis]|uniref:Mycothiol acetyltransferase n=1 Tax=Kitasatospora nipponensis TaxID=258049 RepID=A0ABN1W287_9ACTN
MDATTGASPEQSRSYARTPDPTGAAPGAGTSGPESVVVAGPVLSDEERDGALKVLAAALAEDGREAVSEQGRIRLRSAGQPRPAVTHLVQLTPAASPAPDRPSPQVVGYAQLEGRSGSSGPTAELVVEPSRRGEGLGRHLLDALLTEAAAPLDIWAHGDHPAARHLAARYGAELVRELRQMRRGGPFTVPLESTPLPAGVTLRTFRPGVDDEAWLRLNALAFSHHPEQGSWTAQDLADRMAEPWFDPAGFFLAFRGERLVGFHWTKVHPAGVAGPALGEVYVVGVDPQEQGSGLGRALTAAGLRHLTGSGPGDRGLGGVLLYVDEGNTAAVRVYERLGFTVHEVDLMYRVPSPK